MRSTRLRLSARLWRRSGLSGRGFPHLAVNLLGCLCLDQDRVYFDAEQENECRDVKPTEKGDNATQGAVCRAVRPEMADIYAERKRCEEPATNEEQRAGADPPERQLDVGRDPIDDIGSDQNDEESDRPAGKAKEEGRRPLQSYVL